MPQSGCSAKAKPLTKIRSLRPQVAPEYGGDRIPRTSPAEYKAGLDLAIIRGWLVLHESGTYVKFTGGCGVVRLMAADWSREFDDLIGLPRGSC
jgi:hypothetical protein